MIKYFEGKKNQTHLMNIILRKVKYLPFWSLNKIFTFHFLCSIQKLLFFSHFSLVCKRKVITLSEKKTKLCRQTRWKKKKWTKLSNEILKISISETSYVRVLPGEINIDHILCVFNHFDLFWLYLRKIFITQNKIQFD